MVECVDQLFYFMITWSLTLVLLIAQRWRGVKIRRRDGTPYTTDCRYVGSQFTPLSFFHHFSLHSLCSHFTIHS